MQTDAGLVEHVDDPDQPHAQLRSEPHPLRLTAAERRILAVERQVAEPGLEQKMQALFDPRHHLAQGFNSGQPLLQAKREGVRRGNIQGKEIRDAGAAGT